ncbi:MAG TPA: TIGR04282 family arsenosugar biosynthesis glycosyltransferase [Dissulfurispiraceae bacterium]|nr:TIGR04282 family arsenosugar biosynthesis glycosyltransferase [Dissulfurispiraceae bacterium]
MSSRYALGVFLKYPEPGRVKTRLAVALGAESSAEVYRALAEQVLSQTGPLKRRYERTLFVTPEEGLDEFRRWLPNERIVPQRGDSLGERMAAAIGTLLMSSDFAVVIGSDIPDLDESHIISAFDVLASHDLVIGPAEDGGYYLVGMKRLYRPLFEGIAWSSPSVLSETCAKAEALGLSCRLLPELIDIDTVEDYRKWQSMQIIRMPCRGD